MESAQFPFDYARLGGVAASVGFFRDHVLELMLIMSLRPTLRAPRFRECIRFLNTRGVSRVLLSLFGGVLAAEAAPGPIEVSTGPITNYTQNGATVTAAPALNLSGGGNFVSGALQFALSSTEATETLGLTTVATPDVTAGVVSIVGTTVYLGKGAQADAIGSVDGLANGKVGQPLKINFVASAFDNASFEDSTTTGWEISNSRVILGAGHQIAGFPVPLDPTPTPSTGGLTSPGDATPAASSTFTTTISSNVASGGVNGTKSLSLALTGRVDGGGILRGPAAVSATSFHLNAGNSISFWWSASPASDAYDVFGYLLNVDNGNTQILINATGNSGSATQAWTKVTATANATGNYKFVFISGSFDYSFGRALGASLLIDNVQIDTGTFVDSSVVQALGRLVTYSNTSLDPSATRNLTITATDGAGESGSTTHSIGGAPVNNPPQIASIAEFAATPQQPPAAIAGNLQVTDPDDTRLTGATVKISANRQTGDVLGLVTNSGTMGPIPASYDSTSATLTLTGTATIEQYRAALRAVTFATTSTSSTSRTITFSVTDANHAATGALSATATMTVSITAPAPEITNEATLTASYGSTVNFAITTNTVLEVTAFSAAGLPPGLSFNAQTGTISGVPTQTGVYSLTLKATNAAGTGSKVVTLTVNAATASITLSNLDHTYNGSPKSASAQTNPAGLPVVITYDSKKTAPTNAGSYAVVATIDAATHVATASGTLTIAQAGQSVSFADPGAVRPGQSVTLAASSSANLPVTFSVVSGAATLNGSTLTINGAGSIVVRATVADSTNYKASFAERTINSSKLSQTITFPALYNKLAIDGPFEVSASASSGLPVTFTVVSGSPALISGNRVTLTGAPGTVTIRAAQSGNDNYSPADDVLQSFEVAAENDRVFMGALIQANSAPVKAPVQSGNVRSFALSDDSGKVGDVAAVLPSQQKTGSLLIVAPSAHINAFTSFTLADDSSYTASVQQGGPTPGMRTISGWLMGNTLSGVIQGTGISFSTQVESRNGPSVNSSGLYRSAALETAQGTTYTIIGSDNNVLVLAVTPTFTVGGTATLQSNGTFQVQAAIASGETVTLQGAVDAPTTTVSGTILVPNKAPIGFAGLETRTLRSDRLFGLSSRGRVGTGEKILISGVVIGGNEPKQVLIRAVGPSLAALGISGALADPTLRVFKGSTIVAENDDWGSSPNASAAAAVAQRVGAFALGNGSKDAMIVATLEPGAYTVHVGGGEGVALADIYDASENPQAEYQRLIDISTRGEVGTGENVLIGGLVITGNAPKKVLIRGVGPGLAAQGVAGPLADPVLKVFKGSEQIATNDNWSADASAAAQITAAETATGAFHLANGSKDAAIVMTLAPGLYTVHVAGVNNTTGVALVEIYEVE